MSYDDVGERERDAKTYDVAVRASTNTTITIGAETLDKSRCGRKKQQPAKTPTGVGSMEVLKEFF
jgi:hypothetical protein